jgi:hypothetical protein
MSVFTGPETPAEQHERRRRDERQTASETRHALAQQRRADVAAEECQRQDTRSERERREAQQRREQAQQQEGAKVARQREWAQERQRLTSQLANAQAALTTCGGVDLSSEEAAIGSLDNAARRLGAEALVERAERALQRFEDQRHRR